MDAEKVCYFLPSRVPRYFFFVFEVCLLRGKVVTQVNNPLRTQLPTSTMAAPPPTVFSLAALFDVQPTDPQLSLHAAASRPYIINATSPAPASVHAQLATAANHCHPTSILICDDAGKL